MRAAHPSAYYRVALFAGLVGVSMVHARHGTLAAMLTIACHAADDENCGAPGVDAAMSGACVASQPREVGRIANAALIESSGLIASRAQPGVLFTHNDSDIGDLQRRSELSLTVTLRSSWQD